MNRRDAIAIGLQALGSAAALATVLIVSRRYGMEAQGQYGLLKGWGDALVALAMLGLPQTLLHLAYHGDATLGQLRTYAEAYAARLSLPMAALAAAAACTPWPWLAWALLAVPGLVLHGLLRSLMLRAGGPVAYAALTAAPALALLAIVAAQALASRSAWGPALVSASLLSTLAAWAATRHAGLRRESRHRLRLPAVINGHAFVQNATAAVQVAALLAILGLAARPLAEIGEASFSLVVLQLCAVAATYLAPLIYDRFAHQRHGLGGSQRHLLDRSQHLRRWAVPGLLVVSATVLVLPGLLDYLLPGHRETLVLACQAMVVGGALLLVNRVAASTLQAYGAFAELTRQALLRLLGSMAVLLLLLALAAGLAAAPALAAAVALGEAAVSARILWWLRWGSREAA